MFRIRVNQLEFERDYYDCQNGQQFDEIHVFSGKAGKDRSAQKGSQRALPTRAHQSSEQNAKGFGSDQQGGG